MYRVVKKSKVYHHVNTVFLAITELRDVRNIRRVQ